MYKKAVYLLLLCFFLAVPVRAEEMREAGATLSLPEGWEKTDSSSEGVLLEAEGPQGILLTVTCQEGEVSQGQWNLSLYDDEECDDLGEDLAETLENGGYENVEYSLYHKEPVTWLRFSWERQPEGEERIYGIQYYTAMNGKSITLAFSSDKPMTEPSMTEIVDSIAFNQVLDRPETEDHSWEKRIIWIALLILGGLLTYAITKKRGKR